MTLKNIFFPITLTVFLIGCGNDPLDIDASGITVDLGYEDVNTTFVKADSATLLKEHQRYLSEITDVYQLELGQFLQIGNVPDSEVYETIHAFVTDPYVARLERRIQERFSDKSAIKTKLEDGFRHFKFHFPTQKTPKNIVFLNTLFQASAASTEQEVGIGLERYLGDSTDVIQELRSREFYDWVLEAMDAQYLERDVLASWIMSNVFDETASGSLAESMIYWGKILYAVEACFPNDPKHIIIRYSEEDYAWAQENEFAFWDYLVREKMLFKLDERTKMNMLGEGPFTPGLPEKGPDRLGQYLGWQMVRAFNNDKEMKLSDLMKVPYNTILQAYEIKD